MAKIDIITLSGLTAYDGSIVESGAIIKFESHFFIGTTNIEIRPRVYRNRNTFDQGFESVKVHELPNDFILGFSENEYYTITPQILYQKVCDNLNTLLAGGFQINIVS